MEVGLIFNYIHFIINETCSSNLVDTYLFHIGQFSKNRNPAETAGILKTKYDFEIYSIFVGNPDKNSYGMDIMKQIASKTENESHFFWIRDEWVEDQLQKKINNSQTGGYHLFCHDVWHWILFFHTQRPLVFMWFIILQDPGCHNLK